MAENSEFRSDLQKIVDWMNEPEQLEPVFEEIWMAERRLAQYKAEDPETYAAFESWWEAHNRTGSVPTVLRRH
ncbi:MAG: hypothetical protein ACR2OF_00460 [Hyphomicrobium sp.]